MTQHHTFKAEGVGNEVVPDAVLFIDMAVPILKDGTGVALTEMRRTYIAEAERLADILMSHCPQGLVDHLMAELMLRKAQLFVVPSSIEVACVDQKLLEALQQSTTDLVVTADNIASESRRDGDADNRWAGVADHLNERVAENRKVIESAEGLN